MQFSLTSMILSFAVLGVSCSPRTSTPGGCLSVRASGASSGEYASLGAAVAALGSGSTSSTACIFMYPGTYEEQVVINAYKGALTLYGYSTDTSSYAGNQVTIKHSENSTVAGSDEASSTVDARGTNFKMYNIDVENSFVGSQAIAFTSRGDQQSFYGCGFYGYQGKFACGRRSRLRGDDSYVHAPQILTFLSDTLFAHSGNQYYKKCLIQGIT